MIGMKLHIHTNLIHLDYWGHKDPQTFHLTRSSLCHRPCLWEMAIAAGSTQGSKAGLGSFITRTNSHKITRASIWWAQANPWAHMSDVPKLLQLLQGSRWFYCPTFGESCYTAARQKKSHPGFWSSVSGLVAWGVNPLAEIKSCALTKHLRGSVGMHVVAIKYRISMSTAEM